jgi:hypothetical protein
VDPARLVDGMHVRQGGADGAPTALTLAVVDQNRGMGRTAIAIAIAIAAWLASAAVGGQGTSVTVIFHAPGQNEAGVRLTTPIRLQFSAELDPSTLEGHIALGYSAEDSKERGEPEPPRIAYETEYVRADRAVFIRPVGGWLRFREVRLTLGEGIRSTGGAGLEPFSLTFTTGG